MHAHIPQFSKPCKLAESEIKPTQPSQSCLRPLERVGGMGGGIKGTEGERLRAEVGSEPVISTNLPYGHKQRNLSEPCTPGGSRKHL